MIMNQRGAFFLFIAFFGVAGIAEAKAKYGKLQITANVPGATISLGSRTWSAPKALWLRIGAGYLIRAQAPGYAPYSKRVVLTRSREALVIELLPVQGSVRLVAANNAAIGASVAVNGKVSGTVPDTLKLPPGRALLEVSKAGHRPWQRWVTLVAQQKLVLDVTLEASIGALAITVSPAAATVVVDGKEVGTGQVALKDLAAGRHVIEARAKGHAPLVRVVEVRPGASETLQLALVATSKPVTFGSAKVLTEPANVDVYVDGRFRGKSPLHLKELVPGTHLLAAKWPGYAAAEREVAIAAGQIVAVKLALQQSAASRPATAGDSGGTGNLIVVSTVRGASVYLDGALLGQTPLAEADLGAKTYRVRVSAAGYAPYEQSVMVRAGKTARLMAYLSGGARAGAGSAGVQAGAASDSEAGSAPALDTRGLASYGAQLVPPRYITADLSAGYPYLIEGRIGTGVWESSGLFGADVGVELRSNGAFTEVGLNGRFRFFQGGPLATAAFAAIGGGGGPSSRSTFYFNAGVTGTLMFKGLLSVSASVFGNFYSDRVCSEAPESGEVDACIFPPAALGLKQVRERLGGARLMLRGVAEFSMRDHLGLFVLAEGAPLQDERWAFTDRFVGLMLQDDPRFYLRAGVTFKF